MGLRRHGIVVAALAGASILSLGLQGCVATTVAGAAVGVAGAAVGTAAKVGVGAVRVTAGAAGAAARGRKAKPAPRGQLAARDRPPE